jgi:hypothetical protein
MHATASAANASSIPFMFNTIPLIVVPVAALAAIAGIVRGIACAVQALLVAYIVSVPFLGRGVGAC